MTAPTDAAQVTWNDITRWAAFGLITADQMETIKEQHQITMPRAPRTTARRSLAKRIHHLGACIASLFRRIHP